MNGLKPFRSIPKDIVEWTRWMRDQDPSLTAFINDLIEAADTDTTTLTTVVTTTDKWVVEFFEGSYQLLDGDAGKLLCSESATACTLTIPSGIFDVGEQFTAMQYGAGQLTIAAGTGVTINTPTNLAVNEQYGTVTLILLDYDDWVIAGRMTP